MSEPLDIPAATESPRPTPAIEDVRRHLGFGPFRVDLRARQLFRENVHVPIAGKAYETLLALVRRRGDLVTKDELISEVWPDTFVSEDSLTQNISSLRRVLEDDPAHPRFIATVARRGYRFIADVSEQESSVEGDAVDRTPTAPLQTAPSGPTPAKRRVDYLIAAALAGLAIGMLLARSLMVTTPAGITAERIQYSLELPVNSALASGGSVSPDGRYIAFIARDNQSGETRLWVHTLATGVARAVQGSEGALRPFWSPDSHNVAFFGGGRLRRVSALEGAPTTICETVQPRPLGGSWSERDEILFSDQGSLYIVPASGGTPTQALSPSSGRNELSLGWPQFLPGARRFLYDVASTDTAQSGTYAASLDDPRGTKLLQVGRPQVAFAGGHLIYVRDRQLSARRFDPISLQFTGEPEVLVKEVANSSPVSASSDSVITVGGAAAEQLVWFDRSGNQLGTVNVPQPLRNLGISADQKFLIGDSTEEARRVVWLVDLIRDVPTRLLEGTYPIWSPDDRSVLYNGARNPGGAVGIYLRGVDGTNEELLLQQVPTPVLNDITRDGSHVVYVSSATPATKQDIWLLPRSEPRTPRLLLGTTAREIQAQVSPDGRWIAYASDEEDGTFQVYVQAFPTLGAKRRVSVGGGTQPQWRKDGQELFFLSADQTLMSVAVKGSSMELDVPRPLFRTQVLGLMSDFRNQYTVSADGKRFLVGTVRAPSSRQQITVLVNWRALLPS